MRAESLFVGSSELATLMRRTDWTQSAVGAPHLWPQSIRALVRMMLTSRYAMWMGWGPQLTFFYNDAYARMTLGAKHPWALGRRADEVWAEIWPEIGPRIRHVLETGDATWDEGLQLFLERSGFPEETYHTFSYSPVHDDEGRIAGMFCVVTEETDRVIGERRLGVLRDLGARLASTQTTGDVWAAFERSSAFAARDLPFTLAYILEDGELRLCASSGVPPDHPLARPLMSDSGRYWPLGRLLDGTAVGREIVPLTPEIPWPTGPWHKAPAHAAILPITPPGQSTPAGAIVTGLNPFRPFSPDYESFLSLYVGQLAAGLANAQAYDAERRRAEALAQLDRAKSTFFSNVSHELRTPLTLILGPVTDALTSPSRTLGPDSLELIYRNGRRLRRLVNGLLDFSRIEGGRIEASYEPIDIGVYTSDLAAVFRAAVEQAGLRLTIDCPPGLPVYVDPDMWEKVVMNLLSNALKFTFSGGIAITTRRDGDALRLEVRDTGIGIPREELPRIFERFHRVEGAAGRTHEGTGIGLALVQELVKLHGGTIHAESTSGQGTTFTVRVPLGFAHLPSERVRPAATAARTDAGAQAFVEEALSWLPRHAEAVDIDLEVAAASRAEPATAGARVLVADDNADMRAYLRSLLEPRWRVLTSSDGVEALALAREHLPDLVVTDVMMPKLDGFGLLRRLRGDDRTAHIPVMMLSARAGDESRAEGLEAGADDYLVKPFSGRELMARLDANLRLARAARERADLLAREHEARRGAELQRQDLYALFMLAPTPIAVFRGAEYTIELANPSACRLWGRDPEDVVDRPLRDVSPEPEGRPFLDVLDAVFVSGKPFVGREASLHRPAAAAAADETFYINFAYTPLRNARGEVERILAVGSDVTPQVRAREEIARLREIAEAANRAKDEFLAMLGHELRNPLAPILTALQLMKLRGGGSVSREREVIERQVSHLVGLVDDLLDVSRITRGKIELRREPLEIATAVARAIEIASPLLEQQRHNLHVDVPASGLAVEADQSRLAQVLANLLTNAAKYTEPGGDIFVTARIEGGEIVLDVRDTGIGMEPEMLRRAFELFVQERQTLDRSRGGLGLGLAIVRSLVELHGGSVAAASPGKGHGSVFTIRLPRIPAAPAFPDLRIEERKLATAPTALRVLVVDDNRDAALLLAETLEAFGYVTRAVHDGPTALDVAETFLPDIAVLDIGLPIMDGYEVAQRIRTHARLERTRLIAVTGYGQIQDRDRSAAAGFAAHLVKPVAVEDLKAAMDAAVGPDTSRGAGRGDDAARSSTPVS
jgi:signal transduction histidine kinase/two-component SAPR family response regulator